MDAGVQGQRGRWRHSLRTLCLFAFSLLVLVAPSFEAQWLGERAFEELSPAQIRHLVDSPDSSKNLDTSDPSSHLSKILIPRAAETENNTLVKNYIASTMKKLNWHVEEDSFTDTTPYGEKRFTNVIATKDPDAPRRVVVAAHFDSKYFSVYPLNQFVGATDSAMPCALMLDLAEALDPLLNSRKEQHEQDKFDDDDLAETTLQLVFFDGEEAFKEWTATDSVYGARHLAERWSSTYLHPNSNRRLMPSATEISTIEHLILLDLLGAKNPSIQNYFLDTAWLFDAMASSESRLARAGVFAGVSESDNQWRSFFIPRNEYTQNYGYIEDDHIPFMKMGVSILHIIASPFPRVWHTLKDDATALDMETMRRWNMIMRVFMCEYLGLQPDDRRAVVRAIDELPLHSTEL